MDPLEGLGRILILFGALMLLFGVALLFLPKIPLVGRLPGDIYIKKDNFVLYFPIVTCIILSLFLSFLLYLLRR